MRSFKTAPDTAEWLDQYLRGAGMEMYTEKMSNFFIGMSFPQATDFIFTHLGVLLIAIEVKYRDRQETLINPSGEKVKITCDTLGFFMAQSADEVKRAFLQSLGVPPGTGARQQNLLSGVTGEMGVAAGMKYDATGMFHWMPARNIEDVLVGSPLSRADLRSVSIDQCDMCVVASARVHNPAEDPTLADKEALLASLNIRAMRFDSDPFGGRASPKAVGWRQPNYGTTGTGANIPASNMAPSGNKLFGTVPTAPPAIIAVPDGTRLPMITELGQVYGQLFSAALRKHGMLCIGLYRLLEAARSGVNDSDTGAGVGDAQLVQGQAGEGDVGQRRYVVTNPPYELGLYRSDKVFVLQPFEQGVIYEPKPHTHHAKSHSHVHHQNQYAHQSSWHAARRQPVGMEPMHAGYRSLQNKVAPGFGTGARTGGPGCGFGVQYGS